MWLRRILTALWLRFKAGPPPDRPVTKPNRILVLEMLRQLNPALYDRYHSLHGQVRVIEVLYPHVDLYIQALAEAAQLVMSDQTIPPTWLPLQTHRVSLDRFLTSSDGFYLNPRRAVERFKTVATTLCEAMETSDEISYGVPEHNLRMLTRMFVNLQTLTAALMEVGAEG